MTMRKHVSITRGGCERCRATWEGRNAHMLAGKHHEHTGHPTWSQTTGRERHHFTSTIDQPRIL